jgi:hypothetical protein
LTVAVAAAAAEEEEEEITTNIIQFTIFLQYKQDTLSIFYLTNITCHFPLPQCCVWVSGQVTYITAVNELT